MKKTRILRQLIASSIALATLAGVTAVAVPAQAADPVTLTMWTRSVTAVQSQDMVNAFNLEYADKIQIKLTVIPFATYLAKVSAAASTGDLPDILAANVIDGPNYTRLGLWKDITTQVKALSYWKDLAPGHIASATYSHKIYAVPHVVDASSIYYNKVLFRQAGLDPNMPPTSLTELAADAKKISALGNGIGGLYFPGNCAGCLGFVMMPSIWAQGARVLNSTGTGSFLDSAKSQAVFNVYRNMFKDGSMMDASKNETGATQNGVFESGKAGFALLGSKALGTIKASDKLEIGIAPLSGPDGGVATFVGGDTIGISSTSKNADSAWTFIKWTLEDKQQINIYGVKGFMTSRRDLAQNKYAVADPRIVLLNSLLVKGQSPFSVRYFQTFNDANGPWLTLVRTAIFGASKPNYKALVAKVNASLISR